MINQIRNIKFIFFFLITVLFVVNLSAQKTDSLYHINGNIITGEIKRYELGLLYFSIDGIGTVKIENEKIASLKSNKFLRIITKDKRLIYGDIDTSEAGFVKIGLLKSREKIAFSNIVEIYPIKKTFWLRLSGNLDFGIDYSKSNKMLRLNGSGKVTFRRERWNSTFEYSNLQSYQKLDSILANTKSDMSLSVDYIIAPSWQMSLSNGFSSNSELGLQSRIYLLGSVKNYIFQTNRHSFFYQLGLSANREVSSEGDLSNNIEAVGGFTYSVFKYSHPEISINLFSNAYPNLVYQGRWRLDSGIDSKIEIFHDFYFGFKVYYQYDSRPISDLAENVDWGFATSFGYSFN
jgi:hypothetical protein